METYTYPSKRNPSETYTVTVDDAGKATCTCPGFTNREKCWHVQAVQERAAIQSDGR